VFTIVIWKEEGGFLGRVKEVPLLGQRKSSNWELLVKLFKEEIHFLVKDRPDLLRALIRVRFE
jgi:hypothetical protein